MRRKFTIYMGVAVYCLLSILPGTAISAAYLRVATTEALYSAIQGAQSDEETVIQLEDGYYNLSKALKINADRVIIRSISEDPEKVVLIGNGMRRTDAVDNLIEVSGKHVSLVGITLQKAGNHLVQVRGERNADHFQLINCVLRDSYEQLMKVSYERDGKFSSDYGVVKSSRFEYTAEHGPNYYIGGLDVHGGKGWLVAENTFRNIASPVNKVAEFAIHFWTHSANNVVRDNFIVNSDRGIGFGLTDQWVRHNMGGEITGNTILHFRPSDSFADVGIALESSPNTRVTKNIIFLKHDYPHAIEYRFASTRAVEITKNVTNKIIAARDGADAFVAHNLTGSIAAAVIDFNSLATKNFRERFHISY